MLHLKVQMFGKCRYKEKRQNRINNTQSLSHIFQFYFLPNRRQLKGGVCEYVVLKI